MVNALDLILYTASACQLVAGSKIVPHYKPALQPDAPGSTLTKRDSNGNTDKRYVEIPISKRNGASTGLTKRATAPASTSLDITNNAAGYVASIEFGTPAQTLQLILDTGSPLTWAAGTNITTYTPTGDPSGETTTELRKELCTSNGCYNPADSSSFDASPGQVFAIEYVDSSEAIGEITSDTAVFAGLSVKDFEFGLVTYQYNPESSGAVAGIIGLGPQTSVIGYPSIADAIGSEANTTEEAYNSPTLLDQFVAANVLATDAFSLYLDAKGNGSVLLGGVDAAKYSGPLTVLPIVDVEEQALQVELLSIGFNGSTSSGNVASFTDTIVVLDSGTTEVYVPTSAITLIAEKLGGQVQNEQPYFACSALGPDTTIDFYFNNGAVIKTPAELLVDLIERENGQDICRLGLVATDSQQYYLLGDYFLRSAYVVYNWQEAQIAIAQVSYSSNTNISAIASGTFGIPNAVYNSSSPGAAQSGAASVATVSGVSQPWSENEASGSTSSSGGSTKSAGTKQVLRGSLLLACAALMGAALM